MKPRQCGECGKGKIRKVKKAGRTARYKTMQRIEIPKSFEIPTCDHCGTEWLDQKTASALDKVLEAWYRLELSHRVRESIDKIAQRRPQRRIEELLGLSHGYLSKLKSGDRDPSPELVSQLALIAREPEKRIKELEEYWGLAG
ncbi:MAG: hypothetical protein A2289_04300 [Deltaproteobacteria bacterium RIFOXYA12_FULL_58_15]|nr:MAG: hypothetical protein A2289_04300 [Deltaproteobacteria bacterium RIFOXYA12_FULL_58_15]